MRLIVCLLLLLALPFAALAQDDEEEETANPFLVEGQILTIAHQGGNGLRPGNTMIAFEHAVELGVDVLEMDVHLTADGVLVLIHDDTVDRTTDGSGAVADFTLEEIQVLDAGYAYPLRENTGIEGHPYRGQGVTIPALEEVFQTFPDMPMVIEMKPADPGIAEPFCATLREYDMQDQVLAASFHLEPLEAFRELCPEVQTSAVNDEIGPFLFDSRLGRLEDDYVPPADAFQVPETYNSVDVITPAFVEDAARFGIAVHVWTPNTVEEMQRMIDAGVDGIITDYPDILLELLAEDDAD